jgi:sulfate transport system substrate-binding protein
VVDKRGSRAAAEAYLKFLYTPQAQDIIARNYFRPRNPVVAAKYKGQFRSMPLFTIDRNFGGWARAQAAHFNDGGLFDQEFEAAKR